LRRLSPTGPAVRFGGLHAVLPASLLVAALCVPAAAEIPRAPEKAGAPVPSLEKRVLDRYLRDDLLGVLTLTEGAAGRPLFYRGMFLLDLGLLAPGREALQEAISSLPAGDSAREMAIDRALAVSRLDPSLSPVLPAAGERLQGRAALDLGAYLLEQGDAAGGLSAIEGVAGSSLSADERALAAAVTAQALAAGGESTRALLLLDAFSAPQTSPASDLVYLLRGYHHLERKDAAGAREAFLSIPAESLFAPDVGHGMAWVHIVSGNIPAGVVRLEETVSAFPGSPAARTAALDLALAYRELGMFDKAADLLTAEMKSLTVEREWLESLKKDDLSAEHDLAALVDDALRGKRSSPETWKRNPPFARTFALRVAGDPELSRLAHLQRGTARLGQAAEDLRRSWSQARTRLAAQRAYLAGLGATLDRWEQSCRERMARLPALRSDYLKALRENSLRDIASRESLLLMDRITRAKEHLLFLTTAQGKARGFSAVIRELTGADLSLSEQKQLRKIRQEAYDGLLGMSDKVDSLEERLRSLEGRILLELKMSVVERETDNRSRTDEEGELAGSIIAALEHARRLAREREAATAAIEEDAGRREGGLASSLPPRLQTFAARLAAARTGRLLALAREHAAVLRDQEARVLYTAADVEIVRMEDRLRMLQQGQPQVAPGAER
jgi:hypothetical protein